MKHDNEGDIEMYSMSRNVALPQLLLKELPSLVGAILLAEIFFKWGSFTLECIGFLVTWYILSAAISTLTELARRTGGAPKATE